MRTTIRDQLYTLLITASSLGPTNVFKGRYVGDHVSADSLPIVMIEFMVENREPVSIGATRTFQSIDDWNLRILAKPSGSDTIDEVLDDLVNEVEVSLSDRTLSGNVQDCHVANVMYSHDSEGDDNYGEAVITLQIHYTRTKED